MRKNSNNLILNEIMSSKSNSTIILSKSDGRHTGFISDLVRNYKTTFWLHGECDDDYSIALAIAQIVLQGTPLLEKVYRYANCKTNYAKDMIVLNVALKYISSLNEKCLMVIGEAEKYLNEYNLRTIEFLLKKCPFNLKIVIISEVFPDINYNTFRDSAPKMVMENRLELDKEEEWTPDDGFTEEDLALLYNCSICHYANVDFLKEYYPRGMEILRDLSVRHRNYAIRIRDNIYAVSPEIASIIGKRIVVDQEKESKFLDDLFSFYCEHSPEKTIKALRIAVKRGRVNQIDVAVRKILSHGAYSFHLYEYAKTLKGQSFGDVPSELIYTRYFGIITDICGNRLYEKAMQDANVLLQSVRDNEVLSNKTMSAISLALRLSGKEQECAQLSADYISETLNVKGKKSLTQLTDLISTMTLGVNQINSVAIFQKIRAVEEYLLDKRFESEYWYVSMLQTFVGMNLDYGNYKRAIEHLNHIKSIIPFYIVPHDRLIAYVFAGAFEAAEAIADDVIETCRWSGNETGLTSIYALLGIVSLYNRKNDEAIDFFDKAVDIKDIEHNVENDVFQYVICLRAMTCAEIGMSEYAKDIITIYVKRCELTESKYRSMTYGAAAYCYFKAGDKDGALHYAKKSLQEFSSRSAIWLMATAILINDMLDKEDYSAAFSYVTKFLQASINYGMEVVSVLCKELTDPILLFAQTNAIEPNALYAINEMRKARESGIVPVAKVKVRLMGNPAVHVEDKEVLWKTKKAKELFLLYLLKGDEGMDRMELIKQFWPEYTYVSALNNLKTSNNIVRNTLSNYGLTFDLEYVNSKYVLHIEKYEMDYGEIRRLLEKFSKEEDVHKRGVILLNALALYKEGFAAEVKTAFFVNLHERLREDVQFSVVQQIKDYEKLGDSFEVKRLMAYLKKINVPTDSNTPINDVVKRVLNK